MSEEDKKLLKHLVDEMMKVYETNPDVMLYMQSLMENYEKLEQENKQLKEELSQLKNNIETNSSTKAFIVEVNKNIKLQDRIDKAKEYIKNKLDEQKEEQKDLPFQLVDVDYTNLLEILGDKENEDIK